MQLKNYQEKAVEELLKLTKELLDLSGSKKLVFKAPTGSGKTIMMAEFLKRLVNDREIRQIFSFIWTAPRPNLTNQSKTKLEAYFENTQTIKCSFFEDLNDKKIDENEILFINWEAINKKDNIYIRDNEQEFNLSKILEKTKEEGREIILIIDEIHQTAESDISQGLREMINPKLTIGVSATPKMTFPDKGVFVDLENVKKEEMVKKAIILNERFVNLLKKGKIESKLSESSDELVIDAALKKREELLKAYKKEGIKINPLVLIQLPRKIGQTENNQKDLIIKILKEKYNISIENKKLAIWLSGEHINKEEVERYNSQVEVLIFKEAIALGWDCPRAQILVLFREWHSPIFSIQTVGRIMRVPDPTRGYFNEDILNYGYVYTNLSDIDVKEDLAGGYLVIFTSKRIFSYKPINLLSCYSVRHREKTRLSPLFINVFLKTAEGMKLKRIDINSKKEDLNIINDWISEDIDALTGQKILADKKIDITKADLQRLFDFFVRRSLKEGSISLYPEDRSVGRIKYAIYKFFEKEFEMSLEKDWEEIIKIVLSEKNNKRFLEVVDKAKEEYLKEVSKREPELAYKENWNIPEKLNFSKDYYEEKRKKSVMQPFYTKNLWKSENAFISYLEKSDKVKWWFKNGDRDATFFAVPYKEKDEYKPFYVDFLVMFKNGKIGLFDTHSRHLKDFEIKAIGLNKYIKEENKKNKKLLGGILVNSDEKNYQGRWLIFNADKNKFEDFMIL